MNKKSFTMLILFLFLVPALLISCDNTSPSNPCVGPKAFKMPDGTTVTVENPMEASMLCKVFPSLTVVDFALLGADMALLKSKKVKPAQMRQVITDARQALWLEGQTYVGFQLHLLADVDSIKDLDGQQLIFFATRYLRDPAFGINAPITPYDKWLMDFHLSGHLVLIAMNS